MFSQTDWRSCMLKNSEVDQITLSHGSKCDKYLQEIMP